MARECATPAKLLNKDREELRECGQTPHNTQSINSQHSLPDPNPKTDPFEGSKEEGMAASHPNTIPQSRPHSMSSQGTLMKPL